MAKIFNVDFRGEGKGVERIDGEEKIAELESRLASLRAQRAQALESADVDDMNWFGETAESGSLAKAIDGVKRELAGLGIEVDDEPGDSLDDKFRDAEQATKNADVLKIEGDNGRATCGDLYATTIITLTKTSGEIELSGYTGHFFGSNRANGIIKSDSLRRAIDTIKAHQGKRWDESIILLYNDSSGAKRYFNFSIKTSVQAQNLMRLFEWALRPTVIDGKEE